MRLIQNTPLGVAQPISSKQNSPYRSHENGLIQPIRRLSIRPLPLPCLPSQRSSAPVCIRVCIGV